MQIAPNFGGWFYFPALLSVRERTGTMNWSTPAGRDWGSRNMQKGGRKGKWEGSIKRGSSRVLKNVTTPVITPALTRDDFASILRGFVALSSDRDTPSIRQFFVEGESGLCGQEKKKKEAHFLTWRAKVSRSFTNSNEFYHNNDTLVLFSLVHRYSTFQVVSSSWKRKRKYS